jgi:hypothetical protein
MIPHFRHELCKAAKGLTRPATARFHGTAASGEALTRKNTEHAMRYGCLAALTLIGGVDIAAAVIGPQAESGSR